MAPDEEKFMDLPLMVSQEVKLSAHRAGLPGHAVASRMRANEISFLLVSLDPAYKAGLAGHLPVIHQTEQ
jgi:hypothetical protein